MNKQMIIALGGEYGAGAHIIAENLAKKYSLPVYDARILQYIADEKNIDVDKIQKFDEMMKNRLFSRSVSGFSSSPEETVAQMEFEFLKEKAANVDSFIVVNRCANSLLSGYAGLISIFVTSDAQHKVERVMDLYGVSEEKAKVMVFKNNKNRKSYHNYYCKEKWGDSRYYELTINAGKIGLDAATEIVDNYISKRI